MRGLAGALVVGAATSGCSPTYPVEDWTCDFDARVTRPLSEADATAEDGALPASVCQDTCGPPASHCTRTELEGGVPAAVCPLCTF